MKRSTKVLLDTLKRYSWLFAVLILFSTATAVILWLYGVGTEPCIYSIIVNIFITIVFFIVVYACNIVSSSGREHVKNMPENEWGKNIKAHNLVEEDYKEMLNQVLDKLDSIEVTNSEERQNMLEYYTTWVHQIKTPISVMRLKLKSEDTQENRELLNELFRIERYVDMVLQYIRLDTDSSDLLITEYRLDDLIKEAIRKYASQFIASKIKLVYEGTDRKVVTDKKWFLLILEQLLSNAIKYSPEGQISIIVTDKDEVIVKDTGIGIEPEDLPRIFEKGYTGNNGRLGMNSSGLGLYLSKKAADRIEVPITVRSKPGEGSEFIINMGKKALLLG
ncbi:MAG: HAMP domain-containing histidine kinase [Clostridiales bacterium]|nr:HAMP domain-containing histidine kinase [Clostridiales bacterium]